jgi:hypothetical protein
LQCSELLLGGQGYSMPGHVRRAFAGQFEHAGIDGPQMRGHGQACDQQEQAEQGANYKPSLTIHPELQSSTAQFCPNCPREPRKRIYSPPFENAMCAENLNIAAHFDKKVHFFFDGGRVVFVQDEIFGLNGSLLSEKLGA